MRKNVQLPDPKEAAVAPTMTLLSMSTQVTLKHNLQSMLLLIFLMMLITNFTTLGHHIFQNRNAINGTITNAVNRPLNRIRVELQDEVEMTITQTYTDTAGRYTFSNLSLGTF